MTDIETAAVQVEDCDNRVVSTLTRVPRQEEGLTSSRP